MKKYYIWPSILFFSAMTAIYLVKLKYNTNFNFYRLKVVLYIIYNIVLLTAIFHREKLKLTKSDMKLIAIYIFTSTAFMTIP